MISIWRSAKQISGFIRTTNFVSTLHLPLFNLRSLLILQVYIGEVSNSITEKQEQYFAIVFMTGLYGLYTQISMQDFKQS